MALLAPIAAATPPSSPAGMVRVRGFYASAEYGFRFSPPTGTKAFRARAPEPNHGAVVVLGPGRQVEVFATFDAAEYGSTSALLTAELPQGVRPVRRGSATLGGRAAEMASYRQGANVHVVIVRREGGVDDGVNYEVDLTSTARRQRSDLAILRRLLASFRFSPRP